MIFQLLFAWALVCPAAARGAPPIQSWSFDRSFQIAPYAPIYLGAAQWAYVMTPIPASQAYVFSAALLEGTRLARLRLRQLGLFQNDEAWGSVQVYQWPDEILSYEVVQTRHLKGSPTLLGQYSHYSSNFATIVVNGSHNNEVVWRTTIHEIAHHWFASAWRRGPYDYDASERFAEAVETSAMSLADWRKMPADQRYRPPAPQSTADTVEVSARIIPLDMHVSVTATVDW